MSFQLIPCFARDFDLIQGQVWNISTGAIHVHDVSSIVLLLHVLIHRAKKKNMCVSYNPTDPYLNPDSIFFPQKKNKKKNWVDIYDSQALH